MQEIHLIGAGRFFGGGGDRRLRPHQNHQALKCPRCDSLNTKFCYYNNYNLSQPRHFCKSCRRYWTKGGVLRNVPVGGGCRKSKRSRPKNPSSEITETAEPTAPLQVAEQELKSNSHSSSESSSPAANTEAVSAPSSNNQLVIQESKFLLNKSTNPGFETGVLEQGGDCSIFSDIENFTSLINTTNGTLPFGFGNMSDASPFRFSAQQGNDPVHPVQQSQWQNQPKGMTMSDNQELKLPEITGGPLLDQTVLVDLSSLQNKGSSGGFGSLDWHESADQGLFDLPSTGDHAYWGQSQWTDQENHNLYLP